MKRETLTAQEQFASEVGEAIIRVLERVEFECETANLDFARDVKLAAAKHAMDPQQIKEVLTCFGSNTVGISIGPDRWLPGSLNVMEALFSAYESLLGENEAEELHKRMKSG
jgi:hypothetical protein